MSTSYTVMPADGGDALEAVRALLMSYGQWRGHDAALGNFSEELAGLPGEYARPSGCLLLAGSLAEPVGCIAYRPVDPLRCEMKRMFVLPEARGRGVGRLLVDRLIDEARRAGYHTMLLDTHPRMLAAQRLYVARGFSEVARYNDNPTPGIRFFALDLLR